MKSLVSNAKEIEFDPRVNGISLEILGSSVTWTTSTFEK